MIDAACNVVLIMGCDIRSGKLVVRWIEASWTALQPRSLIVVLAILGLAAIDCRTVAGAAAAPPLPASSVPPMWVVLVKGADANCTDACPEWISAEGAIGPGTSSLFSKIFKSIGKRNIPVFINSSGGNVDEAFAIGRMLRARHIDVSVTRTKFEGCAPDDKTCGKARDFKTYLGKPWSVGAFCASACAFLIAGGEHRYISRRSLVGVHDVTTYEQRVFKQYRVMTQRQNGQKIEVSRKLVSENISDPFVIQNASLTRKYHDKIAHYYREMGVSDTILPLAFGTSASDMHWMTRGELDETHLSTYDVSGEALVGLAWKPPPPPPPVSSAAQLRWSAPVPAGMFNPAAKAPTPILTMPLIGPMYTQPALAGSSRVQHSLSSATPPAPAIIEPEVSAPPAP